MSSSAPVRKSRQAETFVTRLMGGLFAVGATGFVVGPLGTYTSGVGARADAMTFFIASILFTAGGLTQSWLAYSERGAHRAGLLAWRGAWIQSVGTLLFNYMTFEAISHSASDAHYMTRVWVPNVLGSACFLVSGILLYLSAPPVGWHPSRRVAGWWEPPANLLGCLLFGVSSVAGFASAGRLLDVAAANWTTTLGAACFLAVGLAPLIIGMSFKIPRLSRLAVVERALQRDVAAVAHGVDVDVRLAGSTLGRFAEVAEVQFEAVSDVLERAGEQEFERVERVFERERVTKRFIE